MGKGDKWGRKVAEEALSWVGTPYKYAGCDKKDGTDCSGMVMRVYEDVTGSKIPRNSAKQAEFCYKLDTNKVEIGDLVFFAGDYVNISHVGIYAGNGQMIHASTTYGIAYDSLYRDYRVAHYVGARRVTG